MKIQLHTFTVGELVNTSEDCCFGENAISIDDPRYIKQMELENALEKIEIDLPPVHSLRATIDVSNMDELSVKITYESFPHVEFDAKDFVISQLKKMGRDDFASLIK